MHTCGASPAAAATSPPVPATASAAAATAWGSGVVGAGDTWGAGEGEGEVSSGVHRKVRSNSGQRSSTAARTASDMSAAHAAEWAWVRLQPVVWLLTQPRRNPACLCCCPLLAHQAPADMTA
jgi:hypothetical protein